MANELDTTLIVKAITEGFDKVSANINKVEGSVDAAGDAAQRGTTKWTELQSALQLVETAFRYVSQAGKMVYDQLERGVEIDTITRKFDNLAASFGTTGDALRGDLHNSIGLLLSDVNQMGLALDLMQLGLAKNESEVVRFATVMSEMGMDTGEVVLAIANQSTMRLDQLGIGLEAFKANLAQVKEEGLSGAAAFSEAFLRSAEQTVAVVGGMAGTMAGQFAEMTSLWENTKDSFSVAFATSVLEELAMITAGSGDANAAMQLFASEAGAAMGSLLRPIAGVMLALADLKLAIANVRLEVANFLANLPNVQVFGESLFNQTTIEGAKASLGGLTDNVMKAQNRVNDLEDAIYGADTATSEYMTTAEDLAFLEEDKTAAIDQTTAAYEKSRSAVEQQIELAKQAAESQRLWAEHNQDVSDSIGGSGGVKQEVDELAKAMEELSSATGSYFMQARKSKDFNPVEALLESLESLGANAGILAEAGVAGGLFSQEEANKFMGEAATRGKADQLAQMVMGGMDPTEAANMVKGIGEQMQGNADLATEFFNSIAQDPKEATLSMDLSYAQSQMDAFNAKNATLPVKAVIEGLPGAGQDPIQREIEAQGG